MSNMNRRRFLKKSGVLLAAGTLPLSVVELAFGKNDPNTFSFAFISDSHITQIKGNRFVNNWDRGLKRAVAEANLLDPRPDFIFYGGDIAQQGKPEEIDHGLQILGGLRGKVHYVMGEHDYYVDLGGYWRDQLGPDHYSFDHKGIHFVVLNSILTYDEWMHGDWEKPMDRMLQMARLDNPKGSPFMVGESQRRWLEKDLKGVRRDTPATRMPAIRTRRPIPNSSSSLDVWRSSGRWSTGASGFSFVIKARHQVHRRTMERLSPRRGRTKRQAGWYVA